MTLPICEHCEDIFDDLIKQARDYDHLIDLIEDNPDIHNYTLMVDGQGRKLGHSGMGHCKFRIFSNIEYLAENNIYPENKDGHILVKRRNRLKHDST